MISEKSKLKFNNIRNQQSYCNRKILEQYFIMVQATKKMTDFIVEKKLGKYIITLNLGLSNLDFV